jgi:hypothetical protein
VLVAKSARPKSRLARARKPKIRRGRGPKTSRRWSQRVTEESRALDLDEGVFAQNDPAGIAASLMRSALRSTRRKSSPYRSAMSMLTFYINRAGRNLPAARKRILERAKDALREQYGARK